MALKTEIYKVLTLLTSPSDWVVGSKGCDASNGRDVSSENAISLGISPFPHPSCTSATQLDRRARRKISVLPPEERGPGCSFECESGEDLISDSSIHREEKPPPVPRYGSGFEYLITTDAVTRLFKERA
jgi:hypothetical protein